MPKPKPKAPVTFRDLLPRKETITIGIDEDDLHELVVMEMPHARWEELVEHVADHLDLEKLIRPLAGIFQRPQGEPVEGEEEAKIKVGDVVGGLVKNADLIAELGRDLLRDVIGKDVPLMARLALRNKPNAKQFPAEEGNGTEPAPDPYAVLDAWLMENLSIGQTAAVIDLCLQVNDVSDVWGKFRGVFSRLGGLFGSEIGAEEEPAENTPSH